MSDTLLVQSDPITRTNLYYHHDYTTGKEMLVEQQDVEPIIERNKRLQNGPETISKTKELRFVASIPGSIHHELKRKGIIRPMAEDPWQRRLMKWLDAHPKFKTLARRLA